MERAILRLSALHSHCKSASYSIPMADPGSTDVLADAAKRLPELPRALCHVLDSISQLAYIFIAEQHGNYCR